MSEPWRLFRYRAVNEFLWQELELSQLYCASPNALNDPLDCRVDWRRSLERALTMKLDATRSKKVLAIRDAFNGREPSFDAGVCCFSIKLDDHLMWSHYANSHRGVCLYYEFPHDYFRKRYQPENDELFLVGGSQVFYGNDVFFNWLVSGDMNQPLLDEPVENAVSRLFVSKALSWAHEEEFRVITSQPGRMQFEPSFLKQVTFGLATPPEHRRLISQMAKRANTAVALSEVVRSPNVDFGFNFPDLNA